MSNRGGAMCDRQGEGCMDQVFAVACKSGV